MTNFYQLLGITYNATNDEINKAYKEKMLINHPDKNGNSQPAIEMTKLLNEARSNLLDDAKRLEHDYLFGIKTKPVFLAKPIIKEVIKTESNIEGMVAVGIGALALGLIIGSSLED